MNIFVLDKNSRTAAQMMCDKHVVKMVVETAQLLCTVANELGFESPYKSTHKNHPCTLWAGEAADNYWWLYHHGIALCEEYTYRYSKVHKTQTKVFDSWLKDNLLDIMAKLPSVDRTPFPQAMPDAHKNSCPVVAYRTYYNTEKSSIAKWNKTRQAPTWFRIPD